MCLTGPCSFSSALIILMTCGVGATGLCTSNPPPPPPRRKEKKKVRRERVARSLAALCSDYGAGTCPAPAAVYIIADDWRTR
mmetsp:Transcript_36186/g.108372  ORF Transcript_36186/g.108372 Transcript_36186/m.108372 type:complete len:82 (-) Transcript_36186:58-303(-)